MPKRSNAAKDKRTLQLALECLELRATGLTYRQIAQQLGISAWRAWRLINKAFTDYRAKVQETAAVVLQLELDRLDHLFSVYFPRALKGDVVATKIALQIIELRARLVGLDRLQASAPQPIEQTEWLQFLREAFAAPPSEKLEAAARSRSNGEAPDG